jgi:hypothetical protein
MSHAVKANLSKHKSKDHLNMTQSMPYRVSDEIVPVWMLMPNCTNPKLPGSANPSASGIRARAKLRARPAWLALSAFGSSKWPLTTWNSNPAQGQLALPSCLQDYTLNTTGQDTCT